MTLSNRPDGNQGASQQSARRRQHRRTGWGTASISCGVVALAITIAFPFLHLPVPVGIAFAGLSLALAVVALASGIVGLVRRAAATARRYRCVVGIVCGSMTLLLWGAGVVLVLVGISNLHFT